MSMNARGHLAVDQCDLVELSEKHGTPLHVVNCERLKHNCEKFLATAGNHYKRSKIFYSYKTNCVPGILKVIHRAGIGAEVISPYELWLALRLNVPPGSIIYNGVNKSKDSLQLAFQQNIAAINLDSWEELIEYKALSMKHERIPGVGIRVRISAGWHAQFGFDIENDEAFDAFKMLTEIEGMHADPRRAAIGVHCHIGSNLQQPRVYAQAIRHVCGFMAKLKEKLGLVLDYLDIGGGIGIKFVEKFSLYDLALYHFFDRLLPVPRRTDEPIDRCIPVIAKTLNAECGRHGLPSPELWFEPGRALSGDAQLLLLGVENIKKDGRGVSWALTNGGPANIAYPLTFERHEVVVANKLADPPDTEYRITGHVCTPSDVAYRKKMLPALEPGDTLAIMDAGAYFTSYANTCVFLRSPVFV